MSRKLGIATIGQSPREDIRAMFGSFAPPGTETVLRGCLDGLSDEKIAARPPLDGADTLYTRLRGERDVKISKKHVIERAPGVLASLRGEGCDTLVFACTGEFPPMPGDEGVIFPSRVLAGLATALLPRGRLGLLIPLSEQAGKLARKWEREGLAVFAEPLAPSADEDEARQAAARLGAGRPDLVAMDCMSYTPQTKRAVQQAIGVPTLLAITTIGRVVNEMLA
ncbi:MAG: AroM family protein [Alphaproteobacteria bacterium]|nr:AroM family protein [Alphaproteobacteria bacterium]